MVKITQIRDFKRRAAAKRAFASSETRLKIDFCDDLDFADLAKLIDRFRGRLRSLQMRCPISGFTAGKLANAFRGCPDLKDLIVSFPSPSTPSDEALTALGQAVAELKSLERVCLANIFSPLVPLLLQPDNVLQTVEINIFDPYGIIDFRPFFQACETAAKLRNLIIYAENFESSSFEALRQLIRQNASLRSLEMVERRFTIHSKAFLTALAEDLAHNHNLSSLVCFANERSNRDSTLEVEAAVYHNMLKHNYALKELVLDCYGAHLSDEEKNPELLFHCNGIEFFLSLNKAGRGKLLGPSANPTTNNWIEVMAEQEDVSVIYYFLRCNPSLCNMGYKNSNSSGSKGKKRKHAHGWGKQPKRISLA